MNLLPLRALMIISLRSFLSQYYCQLYVRNLLDLFLNWYPGMLAGNLLVGLTDLHVS